MTQIPETRESLLIRIQDPENRVAWDEFVSIYRPVIYRLARLRGFQDADAQDLVQSVLMSVSRSIEKWDPQRDTRFRSWLQTVTRNAIVDSVRRRRPDSPTGDSSTVRSLHNKPAAETEAQLVHEYRRQIFRSAAEQIRPEFGDSVWAAFQLTMIDNMSVNEAAEQTGKSIGAIYAARSRIMHRLKQRVREIEDTE